MRTIDKNEDIRHCKRIDEKNVANFYPSALWQSLIKVYYKSEPFLTYRSHPTRGVYFDENSILKFFKIISQAQKIPPPPPLHWKYTPLSPPLFSSSRNVLFHSKQRTRETSKEYFTNIPPIPCQTISQTSSSDISNLCLFRNQVQPEAQFRIAWAWHYIPIWSSVHPCPIQKPDLHPPPS